jgi:hypothetical protein
VRHTSNSVATLPRRPRRTAKKTTRRPSMPEPGLALARIIESLPKDLGIVLIGLGTIGIVIPGPVPAGASFVLLGTLLCWPRLLMKLSGPLARRFPRLLRMFAMFLDRLTIDLERRYPTVVAC